MSYETMKPKVNEAFKLLRKAKFVAKQNFMCCMSCGCAALPDNVGKYAFYHRQDNDRFKRGGGITLVWGHGSDLKDKELKVIGKEMKAIFESVGLKVEWNGSPDQRLTVKE